MIFDLQRFSDDLGTDDTVESGGSSSATTAGGSTTTDNTVFELIVEAEEPATVPAIGEEGCFNNILEKLEDTQNSQTLRYEVTKQEKAAETTKLYSFGRF